MATDPIQRRIKELWTSIRKAEKAGDGKLAATFSRHLTDLLIKAEQSGIPTPEGADAHKVCISCLDKILADMTIDKVCPHCGHATYKTEEIIRPRPIHVH